VRVWEYTISLTSKGKYIYCHQFYFQAMRKFLTREEYHNQKPAPFLTREHCPFCDPDEKMVFRKGEYWYLIHNLAPYTGDERHLMAIPYEHVVYFTDLSSEHLLELPWIYKKVQEFFWEMSFFSFTRESVAGRSVEHLHMHFVPWVLEGRYLRKMLQNQGFPIHQDLDVDRPDLYQEGQ